jgi:hypothetical protein
MSAKTPQVSEWCRVVLPDRNIAEALRSIYEQRKTGSLTVHFGEGGVTAIEWQQRSVVLGRWPFQVSNGK